MPPTQRPTSACSYLSPTPPYTTTTTTTTPASPTSPSPPCWTGNLSLCRLGRLLRIDFLSILVETDPRGWGAITTTFSRTDTDDLAVNGAGDAVLQFEIHLGHGVFGENRGVGDVTDCCRLDHVANGESLDCLVLGCTPRAVGASNRLHMASSFLVATV